LDSRLKTLGSNSSFPAGDYQQIRLLLADNSSSSAAFPSNACATLGNVFNCVVDSSKNTSELLLSSQANTGLKIPPGQVVGGPIHVAAGQSVDINVDFNACASTNDERAGDHSRHRHICAGTSRRRLDGFSNRLTKILSEARKLATP
jgi:hypothetical protein